MQQFLLALALLFSSLLAGQNSADGKLEKYQSIEVSVTNVSSESGTVEFALYNEEGFMKEPIAAQSGKINGKLSTVVFENIPNGTYAIICFHDANENKRMDFEMNGMPIENYGVSNNVFAMGPPVFESAKFEHKNSDKKLEIKF